MEPDPNDPEWELLVAQLRTPIDPLIQGDVGAIINSTRTALDLLLSALLAANGEKPNSDAHFPIRRSSGDFLAAVTMLESKKWLRADEAAAIKQTRAYDGGDHFLYPIHKLDILRKHERLLTVEAFLEGASITLFPGMSVPIHEVSKDKTALFRIPRGRFHPTKGNTLFTTEILFNEPTLLKTRQPAIGVLRNFTCRVRAIIEEFP